MEMSWAQTGPLVWSGLGLKSLIMRLWSHNMLSCNIKVVMKEFPPGTGALKLKAKDAEFNPNYLCNLFAKLDWKAFHNSAPSV